MALPDSKKALLWGAFFVALLLVLPARADDCDMPGVGQSVASRYVIDGDTLELVDGRRVRLIGLNAPEIGRAGRASEPWAQTARRELQRMVRGAELYLLVGDKVQDRYGRTLGHLFDGEGRNIEARLLRQGLGFTVAIAPNVLLVSCHLQHEQQARQHRRGVWQQSPVRRAEDIEGAGFQILRGLVKRVANAGEYVWLELDGPLALRLPVGQVGKAGVAGWRGREVEVRGWVRYRGEVQPGRRRYMLQVDDMRLLRVE